VVRSTWRQLVKITRQYFVAGLLAFAPIGITVWAIGWIIQRLDNLLLPRLIQAVSPGLDSPPDIPPLVGLVFTFVVILLSGVIARHFFGAEFVRLWERWLLQVPIARTIYGGVKQLFEAIAHSSAGTYNRVVLIEYPRKGLFALAFTTGHARGPVKRALPDRDLVNCFVPTTPNPTSGFYLLVDEAEITEVDLSVEDAFKVIMSAGLVTPPGKQPVQVDTAAPPIQPAEAGVGKL
jgi:uncharacterized membrane protein